MKSIFGFALCAVLLALCVSVEAQQPKKAPRIGYLTSSGRASFEAFATALRQLGYVEGKSVIFEFRTTENTAQLQPELAAELTQLKVDVIVAVGAGAIRAAKNATSTIPIVMSEVNDPIALGFVGSLAHPGGNITGMSNLSPELSGKRLEMLKEVVPRASRIAVLAYRGEAMRSSINETEVAARSLGLQVQLF
jgi:putative tryptophan/tyrosine transport system substrate-binding protein